MCSIYLFIRRYEVARTSGAGPCAPFIYSYGSMKLLGRVGQIAHAPFIYSYGFIHTLKFLERVEQVTYAPLIHTGAGKSARALEIRRKIYTGGAWSTIPFLVVFYFFTNCLRRLARSCVR